MFSFHVFNVLIETVLCDNCFKILVRDNSSICVNLVSASVHCLFSFGLRFFFVLSMMSGCDCILGVWVLCYENMDLTQISVLIQPLTPCCREEGDTSSLLEVGVSPGSHWPFFAACGRVSVNAGEGEVQVPLDDTVIHIVCFILGKIT